MEIIKASFSRNFVDEFCVDNCRPFEHTITLQKDSVETIVFVFKDNKITAIVNDWFAARNGVLTEHHMVEVNGQNVVGVKVGYRINVVDFKVGCRVNSRWVDRLMSWVSR